MGCFVPKEFYSRFGGYGKIPLSMDYEWFLRTYRDVDYNIMQEIVIGRFYIGGVSSILAYRSFIENYKLQRIAGIGIFIALFRLIISIVRHTIMKWYYKWTL